MSLAVRRDSHDDPLLGFLLLQGLTRSTYRAPLDARHLSGVRSPSAHTGGGVYVTSADGPIRQLRSVLRFFQPLDGLLLHPPSASLDAVTLVGFSLQGFPLPNRSSHSSCEASPHDVAPSACALST